MFTGELSCMNRPVWSTGSQQKELFITTWLFYKASQFRAWSAFPHCTPQCQLLLRLSLIGDEKDAEFCRCQGTLLSVPKGCVPLTKGHSQRSRFPNADNKEAITVPQQSWGINGEVLTEMPLSKTAWKCHNVIRVFVICGHFIQAWQHIWGNLGKHLDLSFLQ